MARPSSTMFVSRRDSSGSGDIRGLTMPFGVKAGVAAIGFNRTIFKCSPPALGAHGVYPD